MRKTRLVLLLLVLVAVFGLTAPGESRDTCTKSCEHTCLVRFEACLAGSIPACAGNFDCCEDRVASCYACCTWY